METGWNAGWNEYNFANFLKKNKEKLPESEKKDTINIWDVQTEALEEPRGFLGRIERVVDIAEREA